jgi:hypothetical protein
VAGRAFLVLPCLEGLADPNSSTGLYIVGNHIERENQESKGNKEEAAIAFRIIMGYFHQNGLECMGLAYLLGRKPKSNMSLLCGCIHIIE